MLPSPQVLKSLGERFGVPVIRESIFGQDYAKTLAIWQSSFRAASPNLMSSEIVRTAQIGCETGFHFCRARSRVVARFGSRLARFPANAHQ
jgi:cyclopropane fatty-acyl-phospholipid synthase-like methyltransferase